MKILKRLYFCINIQIFHKNLNEIICFFFFKW